MNNLRVLRRFSRFNYHTNPTKAVQFENVDPKQWQREVACVIYRQPIVAPPMSEVERQYAELSEHFDTINSYKSEFELRMENDAILIAKRKKFEAEGRDLSELDQELGINSFQLCDEWKQKSEKLIEKYNLDKPTVDNVTDCRSIDRNLDRKLIFLVKQKFANSKDGDYVPPYWTLPRRINENGETLRESVEKCLKNVFPKVDGQKCSNYEFKILGNAPIAHYALHFSNSMKEHLGLLGSFIFFYPIQIIPNKRTAGHSTKIDLNEDIIVDYKWFNIDEFKQQIKWEKKFWKSINPLLME